VQIALAEYLTTSLVGQDGIPPLELCAEHVRQFEGESPLPNLMEVKG